MPGHTPGPWTIDRGVRTSINAGKKHVALVNWYNSTDAETRVSGDEHEANASLIAAAPEMLQVLEAILHEIDAELDQRKHSGNDEDWKSLQVLSDAAHEVVRKAVA